MLDLVPKILLASFEVPGWGGASTSAYGLYGWLRRDGVPVEYVNLVPSLDRDFFRSRFGNAAENPAGHPNVHTAWITEPDTRADPQVVEVVEQVRPQLMVAIGRVAALFLKQAAPQIPLALVTSGCDAMKILIADGHVPDFVSYQRQMSTAEPRKNISRKETRAVVESDLVITHSEATLGLLRHFYPRRQGKIYPEVMGFAEWICEEAREHQHAAVPFEERKINVLFVANSWSRKEKNGSFLPKIARRLPDLRIHVAGECEPIPGVTVHGCVSRRQVFRMLGDAKCTVCPSAFDAAPGVLFEATTLGSNPVASKNCGNWSVCHPRLVVDPPTVDGYVACIRTATAEPFPHHTDEFLEQNGYGRLCELLTTLAIDLPELLGNTAKKSPSREAPPVVSTTSVSPHLETSRVRSRAR